MGWQILSNVSICEIFKYNLDGVLIEKEKLSANTKEYIILTATTLRIIRVVLGNGEKVVIKL